MLAEKKVADIDVSTYVSLRPQIIINKWRIISQIYMLAHPVFDNIEIYRHKWFGGEINIQF